MIILSKKVILSIIALYFFSNYKPKYNLFFVFMTSYQFAENFIDYINSVLLPEYYQLVDEYIKEDTNKEEPKTESKFEDKYLKDIIKLENVFHFDDSEELTKMEKYKEFFALLKEEKIETHLKKFNEIEEKITNCNKSENEYYISDSEDDENSSNDENSADDENDKDIEMVKTKKEQVKILLDEKANILTEYSKFKIYLNSTEGENEIMKEAIDLSIKYVINQKLEKLMNCYVMEKTPLGNVLMIYNNARATFSYYSDSTIPYRYLEVVARKYIKIFNCRPIFVDMDEELNKSKEKWQQERVENEKKEERKKNEELKSKNQIVEKNKSVFAKFKSYNKDSSATKSMVAPPKNSIPNKHLISEHENEKILLKDTSNRYTYEGKLSNFNFLKKIDRKVVDKKYGFTFADFKKIQNK